MTASPHLLHTRAGPECEGGFSLTECLLAVGLFSFGLLAAGALITERLREARAAHSQFLAGMLGQDLAARIEVNPNAALGSELGRWRAEAQAFLPDLECVVSRSGGSPPAYRLELRWTAGQGQPDRLVMWMGR